MAASPFVFEQGYEMGRPSKIHVRVEGDEVHVAGSAVIWGRGVYDLAK
jgi:predicted PhzF superfamily epimerase YddE/YHI9